MKRIIKKVAVLGSGIMGSRIACHFAGAGFQVLLLDVANGKLTESDILKGLKPDDKQVRNKTVNDSLKATLNSNPSPIYTSEYITRIQTGNFEDDMQGISACDWIIEVVVEKLEIKRVIFDEVEKYRKPGTLVTSNTSGIPIASMATGRSEDFRKHFCGTHFFNPPRYLPLLEIIPTSDTAPEVTAFLMHFGDLYLGKTTVLAKDTPAFIANRIGVFSIMLIFQLMEELKLNPDEIDLLTGPLTGKPKSATFRTADVVGIDTLVKVANGIYENCPADEFREVFRIPGWLGKMTENNWLGDKSGQGFYKKLKTVTPSGEKEILVLDFETLAYVPRHKPRFESTASLKTIEDLSSRLKFLMQAQDKAGEFIRHFHYRLFSYISNRVPEISDQIYRIDDAMMAGFGWEIGPFQTWDILGISATLPKIVESGYPIAEWVHNMVGSGHTRFYKTENGKDYYYDIAAKSYRPRFEGGSGILPPHELKTKIWSNTACNVADIGDDVFCLEWKTKMNTIGSEVLEGINKAISLCEEKGRGLVIANPGANFSAGANLAMLFMLAVEQEYEELELAIRVFQNTVMRIRYSTVPVVIATHGMTLGGGCEMSLHADKVCAAAETYMGLVEAGVGLIPAGGGTKELVLRAAKEVHPGEPELNTLKNRFINIATAKVSTSAHDALSLGFLNEGKDAIVINQNRRIQFAKRSVVEMSESGYVAPIQPTNIKVPGRLALGALYAGINGMQKANYATEHDGKVAKKLAFVMCGGDLSEPSLVSEQFLLDLEREAFLSLCGERKTLERIESVLKVGKPVRN